MRQRVHGVHTPRRLIAGLLGVLTLAGLTMVGTAGAAGAAPSFKQGAGIAVGPTPGGNKAGTWLGQYIVNGKKTFCVDYALPAPSSNQPYKPGDTLKTKWGTAIPSAEASDISYLLLKYGETTDNTAAAGVAHLLHSWTAPVVKGHPGNPHDPIFKGMSTIEIQKNLAYDSGYYSAHMSAALRKEVKALKAEAAANRAPWTVTMTPPAHPQINQPGTWTLTLVSGAKNPVTNVPVTLKSSDATIDGKNTAQVTTDAKGTAQVKVTPTGKNPTISASLISPNALPRVQIPVNTPNVQKVVLGGGEQNLTTTFEIKPGQVQVTKSDSDTKKGIAGVSLRITAKDGSSPALTFTGGPLLGADKQPAVVQTSTDGTANVPDLAAPQDICVTETAPAKGYDQAFDPKNPPKVCGTISPGKTLALALSNKANQVTVPVKIPAGGSAGTVLASSDTVTHTSPYGLLGIGAGLLLVAGVGGGVARRKLRRR